MTRSEACAAADDARHATGQTDMDLLADDALASVFEQLSFVTLHLVAGPVCRRWLAACNAAVAERAALEWSGAVEFQPPEGLTCLAVRRPCFLGLYRTGQLAVTNRWGIGHVYILDVASGRSVETLGSFSGDEQEHERTDQLLNCPRGLARSRDALYVLDAGNQRLRRLGDDGVFTGSSPLGTARAVQSDPQDVALLPDGRVCVTFAPPSVEFRTKSSNSPMHVFRPSFDPSHDGAVRFGSNARFGRFGRFGRAWGELLQPRGCCGWGAEIFVADAANHRVLAYDASSLACLRMLGHGGAGNTPSPAPGRFNVPVGVAAVGGCLLVSESEGRRVQVLTLHGEPLQVLRPPGGGALRGVCWDAECGRMYAADYEHNRVHVLRANAERLRRMAARRAGGVDRIAPLELPA